MGSLQHFFTVRGLPSKERLPGIITPQFVTPFILPCILLQHSLSILSPKTLNDLGLARQYMQVYFPSSCQSVQYRRVHHQVTKVSYVLLEESFQDEETPRSKQRKRLINWHLMQSQTPRKPHIAKANRSRLFLESFASHLSLRDMDGWVDGAERPF